MNEGFVRQYILPMATPLGGFEKPSSKVVSREIFGVWRSLALLGQLLQKHDKRVKILVLFIVVHVSLHEIA